MPQGLNTKTLKHFRSASIPEAVCYDKKFGPRPKELMPVRYAVLPSVLLVFVPSVSADNQTAVDQHMVRAALPNTISSASVILWRRARRSSTSTSSWVNRYMSGSNWPLASARRNCCNASAPAAYQALRCDLGDVLTPSPSRKLTTHLRGRPMGIRQVFGMLIVCATRLNANLRIVIYITARVLSVCHC